jgi:hypothetical protein
LALRKLLFSRGVLQALQNKIIFSNFENIELTLSCKCYKKYLKYTSKAQFKFSQKNRRIVVNFRPNSTILTQQDCKSLQKQTKKPYQAKQNPNQGINPSHYQEQKTKLVKKANERKLRHKSKWSEIIIISVQIIINYKIIFVSCYPILWMYESTNTNNLP